MGSEGEEGERLASPAGAAACALRGFGSAFNLQAIADGAGGGGRYVSGTPGLFGGDGGGGEAAAAPPPAAAPASSDADAAAILDGMLNDEPVPFPRGHGVDPDGPSSLVGGGAVAS